MVQVCFSVNLQLLSDFDEILFGDLLWLPYRMVILIFSSSVSVVMRFASFPDAGTPIPDVRVPFVAGLI
jgi:hypothetical protein